MKWLPNVLGGLFYDNIDYKGILFWYEEIKGIAEKIESITTPKPQ